MLYLKTLQKAQNYCAIFLVISSLFLIQACGDDDDGLKDANQPEVSFTNMSENMSVWNTVNISLDTKDSKSISSIEVFIDGNLLTTLTSAPFEASWDSNTVPDGTHNIKAVVSDQAGNKTEKEIKINVQNKLVTIQIAADQLYQEEQYQERGFVFLSDENGNVVAFTEYKNGNNVTLKSSTFNGTKFYLTEVLAEVEDNYEYLRMWTFGEIERGKNWVLFNAEEEKEIDSYVGDANLNFNGMLENYSYNIYSSDDQTQVDELNSTATLRLSKNPSKLYVMKYLLSGEMSGPVGYKLFSNIIVGENAPINLSQVTQPLTKITANLPEGTLYSSVELTAYPTVNDYSDKYRIGYYSSGSEKLSYDIYYPGAAFPAYFSDFYYETEDIFYERGVTNKIFEIKNIGESANFSFTDSKLNYSASGEFDFLTAQLESDSESSEWILILPKGNQTIPQLKIPQELNNLDIPTFGTPHDYTFHEFDNLTNYDDLKNFIRNSTRSADELYAEGHNYIDVTHKSQSKNGRKSKNSERKHPLRTTKN
ncbi:Ig-like domain-containing protein [Chryseosolibacter indicus]|uniref:Ig-like domain-containing protein n=1 Tax=Chryseosolibacter indicus TaxID=2782351 RepID=A0ABS5VUS9_9BACT|nr:Ig-like domain-containing protein [Chryseosolibacter indicus]MBT1704798.1 hypothetical protein [Chryseosolibacter indicus]